MKDDQLKEANQMVVFSIISFVAQAAAIGLAWYWFGFKLAIILVLSVIAIQTGKLILK